MIGVRSKRTVNGDNIRLCNQLFFRNKLHKFRECSVSITGFNIICNNLTAHGMYTLCKLAADSADTINTYGHYTHAVNWDLFTIIPDTLTNKRISECHLSGQTHHHSKGLICHFSCAIIRYVTCLYTKFVCVIQVDIVHTYSITNYTFYTWKCLKNLAVHAYILIHQHHGIFTVFDNLFLGLTVKPVKFIACSFQHRTLCFHVLVV